MSGPTQAGTAARRLTAAAAAVALLAAACGGGSGSDEPTTAAPTTPTTTTTTAPATTTSTTTPPTTTAPTTTAPTTTAPTTTQTSTPAGGDGELVAAGKVLFESTASGIGCAYCHGIDAKGNEELAAPEVRGATVADIIDALATRTQMAGLNVSDDEIVAIAAYLQTLPPSP